MLSRIKLAQLIGFISCRYALTMTADDIDEIDKLIEIEAPEPQIIYPKNENVEALMKHMAAGVSKIDAIREHRAITGFGLKESKDAVERYWVAKPAANHTLGDILDQAMRKS